MVVPAAVADAIDLGELTQDQLKELIRVEAEALGLTFDEAVRGARERTLPKNHVGADVELLVGLLDAA